MDQKRKGRLGYTGLLLLSGLAFLVLLASFLFYHNRTERLVRAQVELTLKNTNDLSKTYLENFFDSAFTKLDMFAMMCDEPDGSGGENWRPIVKQYDDEDARIGVVDKTGTIYYGSGKTEAIGRQHYFKELQSGRSGISEVLPGDLYGKDGVVLSVPILRGGEVVGGVCYEYSTEYLGSLVNVMERSTTGATLAFDAAGRMVALYPGMENYATFYDMLATMQLEKGMTVEQVAAQAQAGQEVFLSYHSKDRLRYLYLQPLPQNGWIIASVADAQEYQQLLSELQVNNNRMMIFLSAMTALVLGLLLQAAHRGKAERERGERDPLTGACTRAAAEAKVQPYFKAAPESCACLFLDLDHFKEVNDRAGHAAGDAALAQAAAILLEQVRRKDVVGRYGGDEFCVWLWDRTPQEAARTAGDIVEKTRVKTNFTVSVGVTMFPLPGDGHEAVEARADAALYRAKEAGRDRFWFGQSGGPEK